VTPLGEVTALRRASGASSEHAIRAAAPSTVRRANPSGQVCRQAFGLARHRHDFGQQEDIGRAATRHGCGCRDEFWSIGPSTTPSGRSNSVAKSMSAGPAPGGAVITVTPCPMAPGVFGMARTTRVDWHDAASCLSRTPAITDTTSVSGPIRGEVSSMEAAKTCGFT
jgi:hypothetical protein